jgi:ABC-type glycerol-3-phosphate transport system permease component
MAIDPALKSMPAVEPRLAEKDRQRLHWRGAMQSGLRYALLSAAAIFFVAPFLWMFLASFKPEIEIFQYIYPVSWKTFAPQTWTLENFSSLMDMKP